MRLATKHRSLARSLVRTGTVDTGAAGTRQLATIKRSGNWTAPDGSLSVWRGPWRRH
jgi:hypothetical protein